MVNKNAGEIIADRLVQKQSGNRAVNPAGKGAEHLFITDFGFERINCAGGEGGHCPFALAAADIVYKVPYHLRAERSVHNLGVELNGIEPVLRVFHCGDRANIGFADNLKAERHLPYIIGMAHPANGFRGDIRKELAAVINLYFNLAVFAGTRGQLAGEHVRHKLRTVANAHYRYSELKKLAAVKHGVFAVNAFRPAG